MKVILRSDVANLGMRGDVVDVANGFARNYLMPRGLAMAAGSGAVAQAAGMRRARDLKDAAARAAAEDVARRLVPAVIHVGARAGSEGKLFGSVTAADIAEAVLEQTGVEVDRRKMQLEHPIRELGTHLVPMKLHAEVEFPITVEVASA